MNEETAFLEAIRVAPTDNTLRLVYADWLDEHDRREGTYLRVECDLAAIAPDDPQRTSLQDRLRTVSVGIDSSWLAAISRVHIENCSVSLQFQCPKRWEQLQLTRDETVRYCESCQQKVFFCETIEVAQTHAALSDCIAIDPRLARKPNDLDSTMWELGLVLGMPLPEEDLEPKYDEPPLPENRSPR